MAEKVALYQIFYEESQQKELYQFAIPYFNVWKKGEEHKNSCYENTIIAELVPACKSDKISICSWALAQKRRGVIPPKRELTEEVLEEDFDVMSFTKNAKDHDYLGALEVWHKGATDILRELFKKLGVRFHKTVKNPIYQNAFCARTDIYQDYVKYFLIPAMSLMENDEDLKKKLFVNTNYTRTILNKPVDLKRVKDFLGIDYVPLHPFILERCFSLWIENKKLNVVYL